MTNFEHQQIPKGFKLRISSHGKETTLRGSVSSQHKNKWKGRHTLFRLLIYRHVKSSKDNDHNGRKEIHTKVTVTYFRNSLLENYSWFYLSIIVCGKWFSHQPIVTG